jgi:hypothetical protein
VAEHLQDVAAPGIGQPVVEDYQPGRIVDGGLDAVAARPRHPELNVRPPAEQGLEQANAARVVFDVQGGVGHGHGSRIGVCGRGSVMNRLS